MVRLDRGLRVVVWSTVARRGTTRLWRIAIRRVVYTCIMGGYEALMEQPVAADSGTDFVCITDDPTLRSEKWQIRTVESALPMDSARSSRAPKILAHRFLPDYDESLYVDNTVLLKEPPEMIFDELLPASAHMGLVKHSFRGALEEEFHAVVEAGVDAPWVCDEQMDHYRSINPEVLGQQTIWCGMLLRRHQVPTVQRSMERWWEHVLRYSRRDQLSFPFVLSQSSASAVVHDIDNHQSRFHQWPLWRSGGPRAARASVWNADTPDLKGLKARIAELEDQLAGTEREVELLRGDLGRARARTAELLTSTSWKVTAPGRAVSQRVKDAAQRLRPQPSSHRVGQESEPRAPHQS